MLLGLKVGDVLLFTWLFLRFFIFIFVLGLTSALGVLDPFLIGGAVGLGDYIGYFCLCLLTLLIFLGLLVGPVDADDKLILLVRILRA